jgi:hypothetical protein
MRKSSKSPYRIWVFSLSLGRILCLLILVSRRYMICRVWERRLTDRRAFPDEERAEERLS